VELEVLQVLLLEVVEELEELVLQVQVLQVQEELEFQLL